MYTSDLSLPIVFLFKFNSIVCFQGHHDGELWGLDVANSSNSLVATVGEDNKLIVWDAAAHKALRTGVIAESLSGGTARKVKRASTSSSAPQEMCARAIAFSPDDRHVAIGTNQGSVNVYDAQTLQLVATKDLNASGKVKSNIPENWIQDLKYNPAGTVLAVATHGCVIALLDVACGYAIKGKLTAHNSPVVHIDWSTDGRYIQSSCLAYELLFHNVPEGDLANASQNKSASSVKNVTWASQSLPFGNTVMGLVDGKQIVGHFYNAVTRSHASDLLATGDDDGNVKIFRNPMNSAANQPKLGKGHSSHVMNVRFSQDDQYLFSVGGADKALMQWRVVRA